MVTLREIAEQSGVSITTVSNVLHGNTKRVSAETIERVQAIIKQSNYVSRMGLSALKGGDSRMIGVVIFANKVFEYNLMGNYFYGHILGALESCIREAGYYMLLYSSNDVEDIYRVAATWNLDGLVAISMTGKDYLKLRRLTGKPVVGVDMYSFSREEDIYHVGLEDEEGAYQMTRYLAQSGYGNICFFADHDRGVDHVRWLGYRRALSEAGLPCRQTNFVIIDSTSRESRRAIYQELLRRLVPDTAWFFSADTYAIEALGILQELGLHIPNDIGVAGFDDEPYSSACYPGLTTVHQDVLKKGEAAFQLLLCLMRGEKAERDVRLGTSLMIRNSTRWRRKEPHLERTFHEMGSKDRKMPLPIG